MESRRECKPPLPRFPPPGGTAGGASFLASYVVLTSLLALSGGALGFVVIEHLLTKKPTMLGFGTGIIAGLVGITPAADAVSPIQAVIVGFLAAAVAAWAISWKKRHRIDDSLDVFAVHGMAGVAGAQEKAAEAPAADQPKQEKEITVSPEQMKKDLGYFLGFQSGQQLGSIPTLTFDDLDQESFLQGIKDGMVEYKPRVGEKEDVALEDIVAKVKSLF